ncbi:ASKHA domain-containing protein [Methanoculleus sp.]|uniref:ASKHA domain-containing protein n=1 Tax=Methanoculleus sp. TaxID=90427 RepID=UPI002FC6E1FF
MASTGVAIDIGTSGIRARSLDLEAKTALSGISTACHPVPGGNLFDHLLYATRFGLASAHRIVVKTVNDLIRNLDLPGAPEVIAVCGNPVQISFLTGREVRDIRYAPESIRKEPALPHGAMVLDSREIGLDASCDLLVPPAIRAEVGADAVALIRSARMAGDGPVLATDFGTNSEMALIADGRVFVGSAAAGPALEGQHIRHGMLAAPGAIADLEYDWGWRILVLDDRMDLARGDTVDLRTGAILEKGAVKAAGITGVGVVSLISAGLATGVMEPPRIRAPGGEVSLQDGIVFTERDLIEAGKAIGAIRAGQMALAAHAGISIEEIRTFHAAGTAGSHLDPLKARDAGLIPGGVDRIFRHGNTSLALACDLAAGEVSLDALQSVADAADHVAFSTSPAFQEHFVREYAYWCEGAPRKRESLSGTPRVERLPDRWTPSRTARISPRYRIAVSDGEDQARYARACPNHAIVTRDDCLEIDLRRCRGASCLQCAEQGLVFGKQI